MRPSVDAARSGVGVEVVCISMTAVDHAGPARRQRINRRADGHAIGATG
jgi:hypothetical protein